MPDTTKGMKHYLRYATLTLLVSAILLGMGQFLGITYTVLSLTITPVALYLLTKDECETFINNQAKTKP